VRRPYDALGLFAHIDHSGDFNAATKALRALGYGSDLTDPLGGIEAKPHITPAVRSTDEPPLPLGISHRHGPAFPLEVLPDWIANQCREIAYAFQVPEDLPAMLALGTLSTVLAGHVKVNLAGSAWVEHVNLYLVSALLPGSGKSPVFKVMTKPALAVEKESRATAKKKLNEYEMARRLNEQRIKNNETVAVKGSTEEQKIASGIVEYTKNRIEELNMQKLSPKASKTGSNNYELTGDGYNLGKYSFTILNVPPSELVEKFKQGKDETMYGKNRKESATFMDFLSRQPISNGVKVSMPANETKTFILDDPKVGNSIEGIPLSIYAGGGKQTGYLIYKDKNTDVNQIVPLNSELVARLASYYKVSSQDFINANKRKGVDLTKYTPDGSVNIKKGGGTKPPPPAKGGSTSTKVPAKTKSGVVSGKIDNGL
jgi:hypothetical protein